MQQQQLKQQQLLVHASVPFSFFSLNVKPQECNSKMPQKRFVRSCNSQISSNQQTGIQLLMEHGKDFGAGFGIFDI